MHDIELYQQLLGLSSPWGVERVELDAEAQERGRVRRSRRVGARAMSVR